MVLADLGRKITTALQSLSRATIINEEVKVSTNEVILQLYPSVSHVFFNVGVKFYAQTNMRCSSGI